MARKLIHVTDEEFLSIAAEKFKNEGVQPVFKRGDDGCWHVENAEEVVFPSYFIGAMMEYDDNPLWDDYDGEPF